MLESTVNVKFAVIDVADVKVTVLASYHIPVEVLIACTLGIATKFVPAITTLEGSLVITVGVKLDIVGLVSPTVTEPPNDTADPLIVILELDNLAFSIEPAKWILSIEPSATCSLLILSSAILSPLTASAPILSPVTAPVFN